jgi:acyl carrier protein
MVSIIIKKQGVLKMEEKIKAIIAEYKEMDISDIKSDVPFPDLGFDSLDLAELVMKLEDELGVSLDIPEGTNTIDKLVEYIQKLK